MRRIGTFLTQLCIHYTSVLVLATLQVATPKAISQGHRRLSIIDCLLAPTTCLVCFISIVNGHSKKKDKKKG
jgi:hypothetical protein